MRKLVHSFEDGAIFLRNYHVDGAREELFLPGQVTCAVGELLDLEVQFKHSGYRFLTLAQVLLRRLAGRDLVEVGALVGLAGPPNRKLMVAHARGEPITYHEREAERLPVHFPVTVVHRRERGVAEAVDYSPGGVQILGGPPALAVGDAVQLRLHPVGSLLGLGLLGQIVWVQRLPELAYGVKLRPTGSRIRRRLERLYERLLARGIG